MSTSYLCPNRERTHLHPVMLTLEHLCVYSFACIRIQTVLSTHLDLLVCLRACLSTFLSVQTHLYIFVYVHAHAFVFCSHAGVRTDVRSCSCPFVTRLYACRPHGDPDVAEHMG
jgi:hypothetical protein